MGGANRNAGLSQPEVCRAAGKREATEFELRIRRQQELGRSNIAMHDAFGVSAFEGFESLPDVPDRIGKRDRANLKTFR